MRMFKLCESYHTWRGSTTPVALIGHGVVSQPHASNGKGLLGDAQTLGAVFLGCGWLVAWLHKVNADINPRSPQCWCALDIPCHRASEELHSHFSL